MPRYIDQVIKFLGSVRGKRSRAAIAIVVAQERGVEFTAVTAPLRRALAKGVEDGTLARDGAQYKLTESGRALYKSAAPKKKAIKKATKKSSKKKTSKKSSKKKATKKKTASEKKL